MTIFPEDSAMAAALADAVGEFASDSDASEGYRAELRSLAGTVIRAATSGDLAAWPTGSAGLEDETRWAAAADLTDIAVSVVAEAPSERYMLMVAASDLQSRLYGEDYEDWLDGVAAYQAFSDPMAPQEADDLVLLLGLPDNYPPDAIMRGAAAAASAFRLAHVNLQARIEVEFGAGTVDAGAAEDIRGARAVAGVFEALHHELADDPAAGAPPSNGRYAHTRMACEARGALAGALEALESGSSLRADLVHLLRHEQPESSERIDLYSVAQVSAIVEGCLSIADAWRVQGVSRDWVRVALATAEHCDHLAIMANAGYASFSRDLLLPPPPDPALELLAETLYPLSKVAWQRGKDDWFAGCATAASTLSGFAKRAQDEAERDVLLLGARAMARRALSVLRSPARLADFAYSPLL